jgi:phage terminase large subunit GpA-like protein
MSGEERLGGDIARVETWFREALKPDPVLTVSQWADTHRILSKKSSSESGKWDTKRTPYLREVMDSLSVFHPAKKVVFKKSSQVGGTECANNWLGYIIDHVPGPTMLIQPTVDMAK